MEASYSHQWLVLLLMKMMLCLAWNQKCQIPRRYSELHLQSVHLPWIICLRSHHFQTILRWWHPSWKWVEHPYTRNFEFANLLISAVNEVFFDMVLYVSWGIMNTSNAEQTNRTNGSIIRKALPLIWPEFPSGLRCVQASVLIGFGSLNLWLATS